uniref:Beta-1,4-N-acetylgalactosaminyltransferase n=1 Tax=Angiostrongylus cantonensis TaxID=6313 RepID=A0A158P638_ANGCA
MSRNVGNARSHVLDESDPKELEIARQTLKFLNSFEEIVGAKTLGKSGRTTLTDGLCPETSSIPDFRGSLPQAVLLIENLQEADVVAAHPEVKLGGEWKPTDCKARHRVGIIIPFRDRQSHLTRLLDFLIPILQRQRLDFRFIVTEQYGNDLFNKGRIMNAAFRFAETLNVDCVIFHDVDMFPQDDRNPYACPPVPRHMGAFVNTLGYQLWYEEIVGGVLAVSMEDYRVINGYSNMYWAWGGEDDDMGKRILSLNYTIERPDPETGRYSMLKHVKRKRTAPKLVYKLLDIAEKRVAYDGLNETDKWTVRKITVRPLYYHLYVDVGKVPDEWREKS